MKIAPLTKWDAFGCGAGAVLCIYALVQDFMGLEGYIEYLRAHWVEPGWMTVFSGALLALFLWRIIKGRP